MDVLIGFLVALVLIYMVHAGSLVQTLTPIGGVAFCVYGAIVIVRWILALNASHNKP